MKIDKELIQRNISKLWRFFRQLWLYGFSVASWMFLSTFDRKWGRFELFVVAQKHRAILRYLIRHYGGIINQFAQRNVKDESYIDPKSTIWVCWWNGAMPDLVKACYNSLQRHAGTHPVQLITKHNVNDFVSIPSYIYEKLNAGIITITHFSDILRAALLFEYGGIWMDATIFTLKDISLENMRFYTIKTTTKTNSISHIRWQGLSHNLSNFNCQTVPEINRWSGFLLAGTRHNILFEFIRDFFYSYWEEQHDIIDYLFIDYVLAIAYDTMPTIQKMIDNVPCINVDKFALEKNLNAVFSDEQFTSYSQTTFHKLTWKKEFDVYTKDHKLTIYGYILGFKI
jgi:hypothetical protein